MSGLTGDDGSFSSSIYGPNPKLSDELEDMFVVEVSFNVPSIWLASNNKFGSAKIKGGPNLKMAQAKISYISGKANKPGVAMPEAAAEILLKEAIPVNGVFKEEKFKSVATRSHTYVPSYASYFTVEDRSVEVTNTIECDPEVYQSEVKKPIVLIRIKKYRAETWFSPRHPHISNPQSILIIEYGIIYSQARI